MNDAVARFIDSVLSDETPEQLGVDQSVQIWYADAGYSIAKITQDLGDHNYLVKWDQDQTETLVELNPNDQTFNESNLDRWEHFKHGKMLTVPPPVQRVKTFLIPQSLTRDSLVSLPGCNNSLVDGLVFCAFKSLGIYFAEITETQVCFLIYNYTFFKHSLDYKCRQIKSEQRTLAKWFINFQIPSVNSLVIKSIPGAVTNKLIDIIEKMSLHVQAYKFDHPEPVILRNLKDTLKHRLACDEYRTEEPAFKRIKL
jgi:hypothetical protein